MGSQIRAQRIVSYVKSEPFWAAEANVAASVYGREGNRLARAHASYNQGGVEDVNRGRALLQHWAVSQPNSTGLWRLSSS
jgi:hypothetical protein